MRRTLLLALQRYSCLSGSSTARSSRRLCCRGSYYSHHQNAYTYYRCRHRQVIWFSSDTNTVVLDDTAVSSSSSSSKNGKDDEQSSLGLFRLLNENERQLLAEQKQLTAQSRRVAQQVGGVYNTRDGIDHHADSLIDSTFAVVIAGEYNAGKSTLINALLGHKLLETGSLPTTDSITIISNNNNDDDNNIQNSSSRSRNVQHHRVQNLPLLQDLSLVDTPGTNAVVADHSLITKRILPSADLILFVTSADRPFSESELHLLESISQYRKSIVVVINKMDVLDDTGGDYGSVEKQKVLDFVVEHASVLLGARPIVLTLSARDALAAKLTGQAARNSAVWKRSNFASLEHFLQESLTTETKIKSKLTSPIGVAEGILDACQEKLNKELTHLESDVATLNLLQSQFTAWKNELESDMGQAAHGMHRIVMQESSRASVLLGRMSISDFYIWGCWDMTTLHQEWDHTKPTLSSPQSVQADLLELVQETSDSIATHGRAQGQAVIEFLGKRPATKNTSLVGSVTAASRFEDTRRSLNDSMSKAVMRNMDLDERGVEVIFLNGLQQMARISALLNAGSLGTALVTVTQLIDVLPGIASCAALALSGALTYSTGQQRCVRQYSNVWTSRAQRLNDDIQAICAREAERVGRRIRDGVAPYTRFVEAEQERLNQLTDQCEDLASSAQRLRKRISNL